MPSFISLKFFETFFQFPQIIIYTQSVLWAACAVRQFRTEFRYFFLVLGLTDIVTIIAVTGFGVPTIYIHLLSASLLFLSTNRLKYVHGDIRFTIAIIVMGLTLFIIFPETSYMPFLLFQMLILFRFLRITMVKLFHHAELNIFYLVLVFYILSLVLNIFLLIAHDKNNFALYFITLGFQGLIAVFFLIFKPEDETMKHTVNMSSGMNN